MFFKKKKKKKMTDNQKKGLFMKIIIIYCLAFICVTNIWSLYILKTTGYDASAIVNAINLVHGGELLFCCVKKIIDSPNNDIGQKVGNKKKGKLSKNKSSEKDSIDIIDGIEYINGVEYSDEDGRGDDIEQ